MEGSPFRVPLFTDEQPTLKLFHAPSSCSHVVVAALETCGLLYDVRVVDLARGEQYDVALPTRRVPTLIIDDFALIEVAGILAYLAALRPDAGLFPRTNDPLATAQIASGLSYCGASLHPMLRGLVNPRRLTDGETAGVRSRSLALAETMFAFAEDRIASNGWWLGDWSIIDCYLAWAYGLCVANGYSGRERGLRDHFARNARQAAVEHALEIDESSMRETAMRTRN